MRKLKAYLKRAKTHLMDGDSRLVEFWFGVQALGTSSLSLVYAKGQIPRLTIIILILNAIFALPQIIFAFHINKNIRHWSNWNTALLSLGISFSLFGVEGETVAVFGYAFLSLATFHCAFLTNRILHRIKIQEDVSNVVNQKDNIK